MIFYMLIMELLCVVDSIDNHNGLSSHLQLDLLADQIAGLGSTHTKFLEKRASVFLLDGVQILVYSLI